MAKRADGLPDLEEWESDTQPGRAYTKDEPLPRQVVEVMEWLQRRDKAADRVQRLEKLIRAGWVVQVEHSDSEGYMAYAWFTPRTGMEGFVARDRLIGAMVDAIEFQAEKHGIELDD